MICVNLGATHPSVSGDGILENILVSHLGSQPVADGDHHAASILSEVLRIRSIRIEVPNTKTPAMEEDAYGELFRASPGTRREDSYSNIWVDLLVFDL